MQPTFMPWSGYFNIMSNVDFFIFLDDAQFQKSSWHNRNRIPVNGQPHWLTVPVMHKTLTQSILHTAINPQVYWREKMVKQLCQVYAKHSFYKELNSFIKIILNPEYKSLSELNIALIKMISKNLSIVCHTVRSSELGIGGKRTERLLKILNAVGATQYLSPQGAKDYLVEDGFSQQDSIKLLFQKFDGSYYPQIKSANFIEKLSILDVVMNMGWVDAKEYVKK